MRFGLKNSVITSINAVFDQYPEIEQVLIYGSRAKGNYRNGSDIDLTIVGEDIDFSTIFKIEGEIDDLLLPYMIDLSLMKQIQNPDLIAHIYRVGQVFYQKQPKSE
jgi:predicted nucleotidyltransferase